MSRRKRDEPSPFEKALGSELDDIEPLKGRDAVEPPAPPAARKRAAADEPRRQRFEVERHGERIEGRARGIDRKHLLRLRRGEIEVEARVDLHGLRSDAARRSLRDALARSLEADRRCVLVIHGRGRHSEGASVLKESLAEWLAEPPLDRQVMAFATAQERDGGAGASYVLLRRRS